MRQVSSIISVHCKKTIPYEHTTDDNALTQRMCVSRLAIRPGVTGTVPVPQACSGVPPRSLIVPVTV